MSIQKEIKDNMDSQMALLIQQTKTYLPFIKNAFPFSSNLPNACYGLIAGYALSVFINQYTIRMKYPTHSDFIEFGKIVSKYRDQIDSLFKWFMTDFDYLSSLKNKEFFILRKLCDDSISKNEKEKFEQELNDIRIKIREIE